MVFPALATTSVGSFPRPAWLADTKRNEVAFRQSGDALETALDDATILVLREQERLGLDILTGHSGQISLMSLPLAWD